MKLLQLRCIVLSLFAVSTLSLPSSASGNSTCRTVIAQIRQGLEDQNNVQVIVRTKDLSAGYSDYPHNRPRQYVFAMKGTAVKSIMNSPKMMKTIAIQVFNSCDSSGAVSFGLDNSGSMITFGLFQDGRVEPFKCMKDFDPTKVIKRPQWGEERCI